MMKTAKIAIFASGSGSNAENIIQYFASDPTVSIPFILTNRADAYVIERAKKYNIPSFLYSKSQLEAAEEPLALLKKHQIDFIVLAGFLLRIPEVILAAYPQSIINIHPSLLPKYGGKGMYGPKVHEAVKLNHETQSGITIHYLNGAYDEGDVIFQACCPLTEEDTPEDIARKVHELEYKYYPRIIAELLQKR